MGPHLLRVAYAAAFLALISTACSSNANRGPAPPQTITPADMERSASQPIEVTLQSKFPGVIIGRTEGGLSIRLSGPASFDGSSAPLYILDGSPMQPGTGGVLSGVNPYDIATIRVLRNPADIAVYGMRGANGVIVITTKRAGSQVP
jgi:TonB-dependent SusC/RagA subfamily outer membrane receptor